MRPRELVAVALYTSGQRRPEPTTAHGPRRAEHSPTRGSRRHVQRSLVPLPTATARGRPRTRGVGLGTRRGADDPESGQAPPGSWLGGERGADPSFRGAAGFYYCEEFGSSVSVEAAAKSKRIRCGGRTGGERPCTGAGVASGWGGAPMGRDVQYRSRYGG